MLLALTQGHDHFPGKRRHPQSGRSPVRDLARVGTIAAKFDPLRAGSFTACRPLRMTHRTHDRPIFADKILTSR
jgi:hypothetical protein